MMKKSGDDCDKKLWEKYSKIELGTQPANNKLLSVKEKRQEEEEEEEEGQEEEGDAEEKKKSILPKKQNPFVNFNVNSTATPIGTPTSATPTLATPTPTILKSTPIINSMFAHSHRAAIYNEKFNNMMIAENFRTTRTRNDELPESLRSPIDDDDDDDDDDGEEGEDGGDNEDGDDEAKRKRHDRQKNSNKDSSGGGAGGRGRQQPKKEIILKCIFLCEFHATVGPRITVQVPDNYISKDLFDRVNRYIIPKVQLQRSFLCISLPDQKILGYPITIDNKLYARNAYRFNFCFVFEPTTRTVIYEPVLQKFSEYMLSMELSNRFLSYDGNETDEHRDRLRIILAQVYHDLNRHRKCMLKIGNAIIPLCVPPSYSDVISIPAHCAAVLNENFEKFVYAQWDLTTLRILPYINGYNHMHRIAALADVALGLVLECVRHLVMLGVAVIVPVFQYINVYRPTPKLSQLAKCPEMQKRCLISCSKSKHNIAKIRDVFRMFASMAHGATFGELCVRLNPAALNINEKQMVLFGLLEGLIRRVDKYPITVKRNLFTADDMAPIVVKPKSTATSTSTTGDNKNASTLTGEAAATTGATTTTSDYCDSENELNNRVYTTTIVKTKKLSDGEWGEDKQEHIVGKSRPLPRRYRHKYDTSRDSDCDSDYEKKQKHQQQQQQQHQKQSESSSTGGGTSDGKQTTDDVDGNRTDLNKNQRVTRLPRYKKSTEFYDGSKSFDEICVEKGVSCQQLEIQLANDRHVIVLLR